METLNKEMDTLQAEAAEEKTESAAPAAENAEAAAPAAENAEAAAPAAENAEAAAPAAENAEAAAPKAEPEHVETMDDYKEELEKSFRRIREGDVMTGNVVSVSDDEVLVDFDYYAPGVIRREDASDDPSYTFTGNIEVGQEITATVVRPDDGEGRILLSRKEAAALESWERLRELKNTQENVTVKISGVTKGGAIANLEGIRGFIPASKLAISYVNEDDLTNYIGKSLEVRVIDADQASRHLVLSAKDILREKAAEEKAEKIKTVQIGLVTEGTVETIKPYGAFVDLGNGMSGLLHISQISNKRIKTPYAVLKEGQKVKVKIIDNKDGKLSLSMKALEDVAAEEVTEETYDLPKSEEIGTSLGSLFKNIKLN